MISRRLIHRGAIRGILTVGLVVMVYRETGPWTALSIGLLVIAVEIIGAALKRRGT